MKTFATSLVAGAGMFCVIQWWQIAYRLWLFYADYGCERGVNHIDGGDFLMIYVVDVFLLSASLFAFRIFRQDRAWRFGAAVIGILNALGWLTLFIMHKTGVLVEYGEFIRHCRGLSH
jgi:hypothetical protein